MKTLGQIAYEAYRDHTGGVSLATGRPIPEWDDLLVEIRDAWMAAAIAVQVALGGWLAVQPSVVVFTKQESD